MRPLDAYGLESVACIKIDVEGHEEAVLRGAHHTLERGRPSLIIECEQRHNPVGLERITAFLRQLGYGGWFLLDGKLRAVDEFRDNQHQVPGTHPYINNLVFLHADSAQARRLT